MSIRIVIATRIFSPEPAAASFLLEAVAKVAADSGDDVVVMTSSKPKNFPHFQPGRYSILRAPVLRDRSGYLRGYIPYMSFDIPLFFRLLFSKRPDAYLVEPPPTTGAVVRIVAWLKNRPYFYDAADIWSDAAQMTTSNKFVLASLRKMEVFALSGAKKIFTISSGVQRRIIGLGVSSPAIITGFGVDTETFRYISSSDNHRGHFIYAGTFSEPHGAAIFIEAFAKFSERLPGYTLYFVGNGTERNELEEIAKNHNLLNVAFMQPVSPNELNIFLNSAVASLASLKPGTGYEYAFTTKIYASLAAGCPVVFSGVGPTSTFISGLEEKPFAGRSVEYRVEEVTMVLCEMAENQITNDEREKLSLKSRNLYSIGNIAKTIVDAIHESAS